MTLPADATSATISGLTAGTDYDIVVVAVNAVGYSAMATAMGMTHDVPGAPTGVTAESSADGTMLTVSWTAPASNGSDITGYKVMYKMTGSDAGYMSMDAAADATSATISGLAPNTGYDIVVVAVNAVGNGAMATATAMTDNIAPNAPSGVSAMADDMEGRTTINVSWMAPADNGGSAVTGYTLQRAYMMADDTMSEWMDVELANMGMDMMYMDTGLMPDTTYHYRVAATNAAGMSEYAEDMATTVANMAPTAAGMISAVTVTEGMMSDAMDVSGYFSDAEGDTLTYTAMSSDDMVATASVDGSMVTITGVAAGTATITVTATDAAGAYAMQTIAVTVNAVPMAVGEISAVTVTEGMMSDAMDVSGYFSDTAGDTLTYTAMSSDDMVATASVDGSMVTITGVAAGTATITVTATDMAGAMATQEIMVTVEAADVTPTSPSNVHGH